MPEAPGISHTVVDTARRINFYRPATPYGYYSFWWFNLEDPTDPHNNSNAFTLDLSIAGNSAGANNYYFIQIRTYVQQTSNPDYYIFLREFNDYLYPIGVADFTLVQDQPEYIILASGNVFYVFGIYQIYFKAIFLQKKK